METRYETQRDYVPLDGAPCDLIIVLEAKGELEADDDGLQEAESDSKVFRVLEQIKRDGIAQIERLTQLAPRRVDLEAQGAPAVEELCR